MTKQAAYRYRSATCEAARVGVPLEQSVKTAGTNNTSMYAYQNQTEARRTMFTR